ncbi:MAG: prephenate dehydrogenase [Oscillospiraceae bacterium]|jgi:prephenate dehydrogenase|nr:prephenate dehydrogenase [Oscillospiraceae bacterium]
MSEEKFTIGIVGLGLMGASLAYALRGFRSARLLGTDADNLVCRRAEAAGAVHRATDDTREVVAAADLLVFCVYAHHIPAILAEHARHLKPGAVVSDICGVKTPLYAAIAPLLPEGVDYVGVHPMAGKERDGFENAEAGLYRGSGFLITPTARSSPQSVELMKALARHIGASRLQVTSPEAHDALIAYTSDLMHIAAAGLCVHPHPAIHPAFTAGAFRDCTRVADINADAWTELLMDNRAHTTASLEQYIADLTTIRDALAAQDKPALRALLQTAGENKREMLQR